MKLQKLAYVERIEALLLEYRSMLRLYRSTENASHEQSARFTMMKIDNLERELLELGV